MSEEVATLSIPDVPEHICEHTENYGLRKKKK